MPAVTNLNPAQGDWAGGYPVVITGSGFTDASNVQLDDGTDFVFNVDSDTQITATTPPCPIGNRANSYHVVVIAPDGESEYNAPVDLFSYEVVS